MTTLNDRAELIEVMSHYADIADLKEFDALPGRVYTDEVTLDFSSVTGTPPLTIALGQYMEVLRASFAPFKATHHAITGHVIEIDGDKARIHAHVRAEHWLPEEFTADGVGPWLVVGFYDNEAIRTPNGWRLTHVKLTAIHQENQPRLPDAVPTA
ncbi:nuclear transport factor 2 family protein [Lentzea sp. DG1S-22]|uniref:nuclear transport factor 2 family protein n=1 Tax=Lentzea sp. DG1S-22 TaxID=3108822 RepID=UPI002E7A9EF6|nr:nuclear transport factor 2 family protein [Lentzea sp. DG1S-22]WVH82799.1 nuclear transport factor 2 family protein [Lentzea sp. DG1S-22]